MPGRKESDGTTPALAGSLISSRKARIESRVLSIAVAELAQRAAHEVLTLERVLVGIVPACGNESRRTRRHDDYLVKDSLHGNWNSHLSRFDRSDSRSGRIQEQVLNIVRVAREERHVSHILGVHELRDRWRRRHRINTDNGQEKGDDRVEHDVS